jgi:ABC-type branched-subunit amino acid transport system ATPase component
LDLSLAVSHRASIIENGMVALQGAAQDLALDPEFKRRYLGL